MIQAAIAFRKRQDPRSTLVIAVGMQPGGNDVLRRLAAFTVRRPKLVLVAVLVLLGVSVALGGSVSDKLGTGGNTDPKSESSKADEFLDQHFGTTSNLVIQLLPREGTVDSPEVAVVRD